MLAQPLNGWRIKTHLHRSANWYLTEMGPRYQSVSFLEPQHHVINATNPRRAFDDRVKNRLHIRRRSANDAEHLGRCRLML